MAERQLFKRNFEATISNLSNGLSVDVKGLRISFKITKTNKAKGNNAVINIYNLAPINRTLILAQSTKTGSPQVGISLRGGYGKESKLLFKGVGTASTQWTPPDYTSKIVATDAIAISSKPFEKGYKKGTPVDSIIDEALKAIGLPRGIVQKLNVSLKQSRSFSKPAEGVLNDLSNIFDFKFDIQNGESQILLNSNVLPRTITKLSTDTGMIGSPYWVGSIVKVQCLIIPEIIPNSLVELRVRDSRFIGQYTVAKVTTKGDNWGSSASMDLEFEPRQLEGLYQNLASLETQLA